jgi:tRNA uridine 5-carboxymethylaminomethyl modification enzyme
LLREDNADLRLLSKGYELGLHSHASHRELKEKCNAINREVERLKTTFIRPSSEINGLLESKGSASLDEPTVLDRLLKRPELCYADVETISGSSEMLDDLVKEQVEIECKYEGYIKRQESEVKKFKQLEQSSIPEEFSYDEIPGLSREIRQKLNSVRPISLGQASRISGMTPAAISILMIYLKRFMEKE